MQLDVGLIRAHFPSLDIKDQNRPRIYFDNPAGTQAPIGAIRRMTECLTECNANLGGGFATSMAAGALVADVRQAAADFLGAETPDEIVFGANMTTLTYHLSRSIARDWKRGDEIILSRMDHDANVWPWVQAAEDKGVKVKWLDFDPDRYEFNAKDIDGLLNERTKLVAIGYCSNVLGTINPIVDIASRARKNGSLVFVDAVAYAPHGPIDVGMLGCDFLICSAYKFYGPHMGVLWGRSELIESLKPYKVRPAPATTGERFETGTQNHEAIAGLGGTLEYLESLGDDRLNSRRDRLRAAMVATMLHERDLCWRLIEGLQDIDGLTIHGITDKKRAAWRAPTVSFTLKKKTPGDIAAKLAAANIFGWAGHSYAIEPLTKLGLIDKGGVMRLGLAHYNTAQEVDQVVKEVRKIAKGK